MRYSYLNGNKFTHFLKKTYLEVLVWVTIMLYRCFTFPFTYNELKLFNHSLPQGCLSGASSAIIGLLF